jgi:hypothetical protein
VPASPSWCSRRFRRPRCAWLACGSVEHAEDRTSAPDSIPPSAAEPSREAPRRQRSPRHRVVPPGLFRQAAVLSSPAPRADPAASAGVATRHSTPPLVPEPRHRARRGRADPHDHLRRDRGHRRAGDRVVA